jgi:hypothetical protein
MQQQKTNLRENYVRQPENLERMGKMLEEKQRYG